MPIAPSRKHPRTKQAFVYQTLREGIMRCDLAPGERLVIDDLARRLHVSSIPVREALQVLQSEGLIVNVPHVGATVAPVSRQSVLEVFTLLEGLEHVAARYVAERGDPGHVERLERLSAEMDATLAAGRSEEWATLNTSFHMTIAELPGLPLLREMTERVLDQWHRVRRYFFKGVLAQRLEVAQGEHRAMIAAIKGHELDRLGDLVHQHNRGALAAYMRYLDEPAADRAPVSQGSAR